MFIEEIGVFKDYDLLDSGAGARLERFGDYILDRPDPAALWSKTLPEAEWKKADAIFKKQGDEKGSWLLQNKIMPKKWLLHFDFSGGLGAISRNGKTYSNINQIQNQSQIFFYSQLNPFKHTGVFPEQSANWRFIAQKLSQKKQVNFLNLFGYTGIASVLAAKLGAKVTHVDASKPSLAAAKENMLASGLPENSIRWILDDAPKFVKREIKRGNKYDAIILDPPAFGRGAKGEVWKFGEDLPELLKNLAQIASQDLQFVIINAYAVSVSALLLKNLLDDFAIKALPGAKIEYGELVLKQKSDPKRILSTGIFGRLSKFNA